MPTRTLHGWNPGYPIDGQKMRLYRNSGLAGTYPLGPSDQSVQVTVVANSLYQGELRSYKTVNGVEHESHPLTVMFFVGSSFSMRWLAYQFGRMAGLYDGVSMLMDDYVPPPTGYIEVSNP